MEKKPNSGVYYIDQEFQFIQNIFQDNGYLRLEMDSPISVVVVVVDVDVDDDVVVMVDV